MLRSTKLGRHSIRLKDHDYAHPGIYFVTSCAHEKQCLFGSVCEGKVALSPLGALVSQCWLEIPNHFPAVQLDAFVVMPNHVHGVIGLLRGPRAQHAAPLHIEPASAEHGAPRVSPGSLAAIVRSFKAAVTTLARKEKICRSTVWQRNYYEHIARDSEDLASIQRYIWENPLNWERDEENPDRQRPLRNTV